MLLIGDTIYINNIMEIIAKMEKKPGSDFNCELILPKLSIEKLIETILLDLEDETITEHEEYDFN